MDIRAQPVSPLYLLERFEVGVVTLDAERRVVGMNAFARAVLPVEDMQPFDRIVVSFHPERSQPKVDFLLRQAAECPVSSPPPMTMIINIPERVLLIKVSRTQDVAGATNGYVLVFHDITELVADTDRPAAAPATAPTRRAESTRRILDKVPTISGQRIVLVDASQILRLYSEGHYTRVLTADASHFCNLSIGDLEGRLDPQTFMRVHRGHIVNLNAVDQLHRDGGRVQVQLRGHPQLVPVSRTSATALLERLGLS